MVAVAVVVMVVDVDVDVGVGVGVDADVLGVDAIAGTDAGTGGVFASSIMATAVGALLLLLLLLLGKSVATGLLLIEHCCVRDREKGSRSGLFRMCLQGTGNEIVRGRKWSDAWVKPKV